jgi:hypothetical protein
MSKSQERRKAVQKNGDAVKFGRAGGLAISKNRKHMKAIGKKGAIARWGKKVVKKKK